MKTRKLVLFAIIFTCCCSNEPAVGNRKKYHVDRIRDKTKNKYTSWSDRTIEFLDHVRPPP